MYLTSHWLIIFNIIVSSLMLTIKLSKLKKMSIIQAIWLKSYDNYNYTPGEVTCKTLSIIFSVANSFIISTFYHDCEMRSNIWHMITIILYVTQAKVWFYNSYWYKVSINFILKKKNFIYIKVNSPILNHIIQCTYLSFLVIDDRQFIGLLLWIYREQWNIVT
jgi:hypothetical protein